MREMLQHAPIGALLADCEGKCLFANQACCTIFGITDYDMKGFGWAEHLPTADRERIMTLLPQFVADSKPQSQCKISILHPHHGTRHYNVALRRIAEPQNAAYQIAMYFQRVLRNQESLDRINSIMSLIEDIIFEIDGNQVFKNVWISDESTLFMPKEHFLGKAIADVFDNAHAQFTTPVAQAIRSGKQTTSKYRHLDATIEKWYRLKVVPIEMWGTPENQRLAITIREITEEVHREQALQEVQTNIERGNELLNISQQLSHTGGWEYDLISGEVLWTDQIYVIFGLPPEARYANFEENLNLFTEAGRAVVVQSLEKCKMDLQPYTMELEVNTPQDEFKWVRVRAVPVVANNHVIKLRGALMDITKEKLEAIELLKAKEMAERAAQIKSDFLSVMSHEIRTPLVGIIGLSNHLKRAHSPEQRETINNLLFSSEHLLRLVNDVLDFNKMESGQLRLIQAEVNLLELIENIKNQFQAMAEAKGIKVVARIDTSVPPRVMGDPTRLSQILYNLVSNAVKHTNEGSVIVGVLELSRTDNSTTLHFSVKDTGSGIPEAFHEEIFKDFRQLAQIPNQQYTGFGLGLTITKRLIELHGSEIVLNSSPGSGAEFCFDLRFALPSATTLPSPTTSDMVYRAELQDMRVLLVEDNPISTTVIKKQLEELGIVVDCAVDGEEALRYLAGAPYSVALVDLHMPKIDGYVLSDIICREYPDTQIIILTADIMAETRLKLAKLNILDVLNKPFRPTDLAASLAKVTPTPPQKNGNFRRTSPDQT